jgi:hypothetical protein
MTTLSATDTLGIAKRLRAPIWHCGTSGNSHSATFMPIGMSTNAQFFGDRNRRRQSSVGSTAPGARRQTVEASVCDHGDLAAMLSRLVGTRRR